jgi:hypothetical protein
MAGILVLGTSGGSSILPSPTILQASSNGSGHRATNSETKVQFLPPAPFSTLQATRTEERKVMRQITKNVIIDIRAKRRGWWITS